MWPDDYIEWARSDRPFLANRVRDWLVWELRASPHWAGDRSTVLAEQATRYAFDLANDHRRHAGYFENAPEFRL
jgi:hypothetical protein